MWKSVGQMAGLSNYRKVSEMAGVWPCLRKSFGNPQWQWMSKEYPNSVDGCK
jgi:hypothetical protein